MRAGINVGGDYSYTITGNDLNNHQIDFAVTPTTTYLSGNLNCNVDFSASALVGANHTLIFETVKVASDGSVSVPHGLGSNAAERVVAANGLYKDPATGAAFALTLSGINGTNVVFTGGSPSAATRVRVEYIQTAQAW